MRHWSVLDPICQMLRFERMPDSGQNPLRDKIKLASLGGGSTLIFLCFVVYPTAMKSNRFGSTQN
jgi:hypothetical protein